MYVGILRQDGEVVLPRHMPARPDALLKAIAPSRDAMVVAVACLLTWDWLADLGAQAGRPFVLGHALSMHALPGGPATHDTSDAQTIAGLRRGGRLPQASGAPAARRAPRDRLRRRLPLTRQRAEWLAHIPHTTSQYHLAERGKQLASKANRDGVAARGPAPAVQQSVAGDLARIDQYDRRLSDVKLPIVQTAKPHQAPTLSRRQSVPGIGNMLRVVLLYEMPDLARFPRVPDCVSSCRLVKGAKASAGKRYGTAGAQSGHASLQGAFAEAAVLFLRHNPAGQKYRTRLAHKQGQGKALTIFAPT